MSVPGLISKFEEQSAPESKALAKPSETAEFMAAFERLAVNPSVDVAKLSALLDLRDRMLDREAADAFARAFASMQGDLPTISETAQADKWKYAALEDIVDQVRPILARHGFSLSHHTEWPEGKQVVIGTLTHRDGHSRTSRFESEPDKTGSKNSIQALGSVTMYGRRYTACELLGIVTRREDNDGASAKPTGQAPDGFHDWADDMDLCAADGFEALTKAWKASKPSYRSFIRVETWEAMRKKAKAADAKRAQDGSHE